MLKQLARTIMLAAMAFGIATLTGGGSSAAQSVPQSPLLSVSISLPSGGRDQIFEQLRTYAEQYSWAVRISPTRLDGEHFVIQMWREDVKVIGTNALNVNTFRVNFFQNCEGPVPSYLVRTLADGLKDAVIQVQGTTVTDTN